MRKLLFLGSVYAAVAELPDYVGPHDRFWRHHKLERTLIVNGVEHYENIDTCIHDSLTEEDRQLMSVIPHNRTIGQTISETSEDNHGLIFFVGVVNAMIPVHAKAVQALASCVRKHIPSMHESRPMYKELLFDEDRPGLGGNNPTHIAPLVGIFLPEVKEDMMRTIQLAYEAAGWNELLTKPDKVAWSDEGEHRARIRPEPKDLGFRASEHLTYANFPLLSNHTDGPETAYTCNFALSHPEDYEGGYLYVLDAANKRTQLKPSKYAASVFLGGTYFHGVTEILGGHREVFSSEMWFNPDIPFGSNLWSSTRRNMEHLISQCNEMGQVAGEACNVTLSQHYEEKELLAPDTHLIDYLPIDTEPNFLIPSSTEVGELFPLYYRGSGEAVKNDEAYGIALPPELLEEFQAYIERNGMLEHARRLVYEEEPVGNDEHRLDKLNDGMTWGCMVPRWGGTDMVWIDPADEECFESVLSVLRRGNFDVVLDAIGKKFDLDGLMVSGIGPIFLSHFEHDPEYKQIHNDLAEAKGAFYNVVVPIYIPQGGASLYIADDNWDWERVLPIQMRYNQGLVIGGATYHGTGECDYREQRDVHLSVAIYLADVDYYNVEDIAGDNTSLWPTEGDIDWFMSQQGRLWQSDGSRSLRDDVGREPLHVEDDRSDCQAMRHLCMTDPTGFRLDCAKTCRVYLRDNAYYSTLEADVNDERKEHVNVTDREVRPSMCIDATNKGYNGVVPIHIPEGGGNGDCDGQGKMEVPEISTTLQVIEDLRRYFLGSEVVNVIFNDFEEIIMYRKNAAVLLFGAGVIVGVLLCMLKNAVLGTRGATKVKKD